MNKEQFEAHQAAQDLKNSEMIASWSEEDREKFKAVEKAEAILRDAGIFYFLSPILRNPSGEDGAWGFHNFQQFLFNNEEKIDKDTIEKVTRNVQEITAIWFGVCEQSIDIIKNAPKEQKFFHFVSFIQHSIRTVQAKYSK